MEAQVSEILENILGLLGLEGSFEVVEGSEEVTVSIETEDAGRLIGYKGETLDSLQLIVNLIASKNSETFKRVVIDVGGWRKNKEGDLENHAREWAQEVLESNQEINLDPMPSWQRRIIHMVVSEIDGVESESVGEGRDRHLVVRPASGAKRKAPSEKVDEEVEKSTELETSSDETSNSEAEIASEPEAPRNDNAEDSKPSSK